MPLRGSLPTLGNLLSLCPRLHPCRPSRSQAPPAARPTRLLPFPPPPPTSPLPGPVLDRVCGRRTSVAAAPAPAPTPSARRDQTLLSPRRAPGARRPETQVRSHSLNAPANSQLCFQRLRVTPETAAKGPQSRCQQPDTWNLRDTVKGPSYGGDTQHLSVWLTDVTEHSLRVSPVLQQRLCCCWLPASRWPPFRWGPGAEGARLPACPPAAQEVSASPGGRETSS
ncbi:uncharacterized protein LOC122429955 [Cervus canadensis]|uniref:uncharacterized protein LOC122429955 n=1 Tax=Cervus canadensis TaxID=1574408 RepID=UPI001CA381C6|nr:uncharacterized protein LOC122429955 [Cervus canadensis]